MGALPPNPHIRHVAEGQDKPAPHALALIGIFESKGQGASPASKLAPFTFKNT
jgi:hypothetical protein